MSVRNLIARMREERELEDILFAYPYLIDPSLEKPRRQVVINKRLRLDLRFELAGGKQLIVELKRGKVGTAEVEQLQTYRREIGSRKTRGILVGAFLTEAAEKEIQSLRGAITFRQLGRDIPTRIIVCSDCRRARDASIERCPSDGSSKTI
jgi:RecB family endonuclease NucS